MIGNDLLLQDGRIKAGDQILEVDGNNIVGLDRDE